MPVLFWFSSAVPIENLHPLQWGIFRIKYRHDRRSDLPLESPLVFYGRYAADIARKLVLAGRRWWHLKRIVRKVEADPGAKLYRDEALTPVAEEDAAHMELYTQNEAARSAVERELRVAAKRVNGQERETALPATADDTGEANETGDLESGQPSAGQPQGDRIAPISPLV
jgi:hypothetical protein